MLLLFTTALAAPAGCDKSTTHAELSAALTSSESAMATMDLPTFLSASASARTALRCMSNTATPPEAARVARMEGLSAFIAKDIPAAERAFAAARAIEPTYTWPEGVAPEGGPLALSYSALPTTGATRNNVEVPTGLDLWVDGERVASRPASWPAIVQVTADGSTPLSSDWLRADAPVPFPAGSRVANKSKKVSVATVPLLVGAGASLLGAAATYGGAAAVHADYMSSTDYREMETLKGTNQTLVYTSGGLAGLALISGVFGAVSLSW